MKPTFGLKQRLDSRLKGLERGMRAILHRKADANSKRLPSYNSFLLTDTELCDNLAVAGDILLNEVVKQVLSVTYHL